MTGETEKKLSDIMKVELLHDKSIEEIKHIWLEYHKHKDVLVATIPTKVYESQTKRGKDYPLFIFPLPRSEGFEFFLSQFSLNTIHFTPLLCYQVCFVYKSTLTTVTNFIFSGAQGKCTRMLEHGSLYRIKRQRNSTNAR